MCLLCRVQSDEDEGKILEGKLGCTFVNMDPDHSERVSDHSKLIYEFLFTI